MRSGPMHTPWFLNHITSHRWDHHHRRLIPDPPPPSRARLGGRPRFHARGSLLALGTVRLLSPSLSAIMTGMTGASIYDTLLAPASDSLGLCSSAQ